MRKEAKNEKMDEDCGGLKIYDPIKAPTKKSAVKKVTIKKANGAKKTK